MPICNPQPSAVGNRSTAEINDHSSEAAKMRRNREQAYFNSYDFDAIEVLPYDGNDSNETVRDRDRDREREPTQRQAKASSVSVSGSVSGSGSGSQSSSSRSGSSRRNYVGYLQRIGAFFVSSHNVRDDSETQTDSDHPHTPHYENAVTAHEDWRNNPPAVAASAAAALSSPADGVTDKGGNFLLPRAMLKYQSVNISQAMPLSVAGGSDRKHLRSSMSSTPAATSTPAAVAATATPTTIPMTNHSTGDSGFTALEKAPPSHHPSSVPQPTMTTAEARNKRPYDASSTITITTTSSSSSSTAPTEPDAIVVVESPRQREISPNGNGLPKRRSDGMTILGDGKSNESEDQQKHRQAPRLEQQQQQQPQKRQHGRSSSHQSHCSKSGSSGYYSSNVCSTYSLDDHIYSEPVIDILVVNSKSKSVDGERARQQQLQQPLPQPNVDRSTTATAQPAAVGLLLHQSKSNRGRDMTLTVGGQSEVGEDDEDGDAGSRRHALKDARVRGRGINFDEKLRILETSIENLDRHLKKFSGLNCHEQPPPQQPPPLPLSTYHHLKDPMPTIIEGYDASAAIVAAAAVTAQPALKWQRDLMDDVGDDSLLDIDLDSFLLERKQDIRRPDCGGSSCSKPAASKRSPQPLSDGGIVNPSFVIDDEEENHYKCAKYINSCPEDAYRVESDIAASSRLGSVSMSVSVSERSHPTDNYVKRYEDQLHFHNTRELLEDVREKIRLLSQANSCESQPPSSDSGQSEGSTSGSHMGIGDPSVAKRMPAELEAMIKTLKCELESYLDRMNRHSDLEIRQLCTGLVKNQNMIKIQKAFERRRSSVECPGEFYAPYEAIGGSNVLAGVPLRIREQITSIRCASDPNFKMKRKSLTEVFPVAAECYTTTTATSAANALETIDRPSRPLRRSQLQRNLSFHEPILQQLGSKTAATAMDSGKAHKGVTAASGEVGNGTGDKDKAILQWHREKPSIWEMYYGTNRMNQSLLGKPMRSVVGIGVSGAAVASTGGVSPISQAPMSYPSSRPESDFTLDVPRAEQLRIKMEKEKRFRQRCRYITTFLSLVFFLLTVMVVSLVLTRGKRMFGSMI